MKLLLLDIGNTNITITISQNNKAGDIWRLTTDINTPEKQYQQELLNLLMEQQITIDEIHDLIISSVVPTITDFFQNIWYTLTQKKPFIINAALLSNITIDLVNPEEMGADLLVAAVAAHAKYQTTCIIVDLGTATTITVVTQDGHFLGGSIMLGIEKSLETLLHDTAQLSFVPQDDTHIPAIGNSTQTAIQSGIVYGYGGLIDNTIAHIIQELPAHADITFIATGGQAKYILPYSNYLQTIDDNLLFEGMLILYNLNNK